MTFSTLFKPTRLKLPSRKGSWKRRLRTDLKQGLKYLTAGALMAGGAEAVSHLASTDPELASGPNWEIVTFEDIRPSIIKMDSFKASTEGRHKFPLLMIVLLILVCSITIIACLPIL